MSLRKTLRLDTKQKIAFSKGTPGFTGLELKKKGFVFGADKIRALARGKQIKIKPRGNLTRRAVRFSQNFERAGSDFNFNERR